MRILPYNPIAALNNARCGCEPQQALTLELSLHQRRQGRGWGGSSRGSVLPESGLQEGIWALPYIMWSSIWPAMLYIE